MSERKTIRFVGYVALPVGRRVKVTHYQRKEVVSNFFSGDTYEMKEIGPPRIEDLETGIVYGHFLHHKSGGISPGAVNITSTALLPNLSVKTSYEALVKACHINAVSFDRSGSDFGHHETYLELEAEE